MKPLERNNWLRHKKDMPTVTVVLAMARLTSDESLMGLLLFLPLCAKLKDLDLCGTRQLNSSCRALLNLTLLLPSVGSIGFLQP